MGMVVVLSHITFAEANPRFQKGCRTRPSRYLQSFFINPRCPPSVVPVVAASIDLHHDEVLNVPGREAHAAVLETDNRKGGEHLSAAKVRSSKEPTFLE